MDKANVIRDAFNLMEKTNAMIDAYNLKNKWEVLWSKYLETKNIEGLENLLDDDFIYYDENGSLNKLEFIEEYQLLNKIIRLCNPKEIITCESENVIFSSGLLEISQRIFNQETKQIIRFTKIWQRKESEFKVVLLQTTKMILYHKAI